MTARIDMGARARARRQAFADVARGLRDAAGTWVPIGVLRGFFGGVVGWILRRLEGDGLVERHQYEGDDGRPCVFYRWRSRLT